MKKVLLLVAFTGLLASGTIASTYGDDKDKKKKECCKKGEGKACAGEKKEGCAKGEAKTCCKKAHDEAQAPTPSTTKSEEKK